MHIPKSKQAACRLWHLEQGISPKEQIPAQSVRPKHCSSHGHCPWRQSLQPPKGQQHPRAAAPPVLFWGISHLSFSFLQWSPAKNKSGVKKPCKACPFGCCPTSFSSFCSDGRSYSSCSHEPTPASSQICPNTKSFHLLNLPVVFWQKPPRYWQPI